MAKAYTDLEQSKRLAEFLPLKSADMYYEPHDNECSSYSIHCGKFVYIDYHLLLSWQRDKVVPCWSLTALFDALPKTIGSYSKMMGYFDDAYHCDYLDEDGESIGLGTTADNLVDAVYEMVLKLNKPK